MKASSKALSPRRVLFDDCTGSEMASLKCRPHVLQPVQSDSRCSTGLKCVWHVWKTPASTPRVCEHRATGSHCSRIKVVCDATESKEQGAAKLSHACLLVRPASPSSLNLIEARESATTALSHNHTDAGIPIKISSEFRVLGLGFRVPCC